MNKKKRVDFRPTGHQGLYRRGRGADAPYWGSVKIEGRWTKKNLGTPNMEAALEKWAELRRKAKAGGWRVPLGTSKIPTLSEFLPEVIEDLRGTNLKATSIQAYETVGLTFLNLMGDYRLPDIGPKSIKLYLKKRRDLGRTGQTLRHDLVGMSVILRKAVKAGFIEVNPISSLEPRERPAAELKPHRNLTDEEIRLLIDKAREQGKPLSEAIVYLGMNLGLRASELMGLKFSDIDYRAGIIRLAPGKTKIGRVLPMNEPTARILIFLRNNWIGGGNQEILPRTQEQKTFVICRENGTSYKEPVDKNIEYRGHPTFANLLFRKLAKAAGVKASIHALRHTFCTNLNRARVGAYTLTSLSGHSQNSLGASGLYVNFTPEDLKDAMKALELYCPVYEIPLAKRGEPQILAKREPSPLLGV